MQSATKHLYLNNVSSLELFTDKCIGCGMCQIVCPHRVFIVDNKKAQIVERDRCIECGGCSHNCPVAAINVKTGTGCASAIIFSWLTGKEPSCDIDNGSSCC